MNAEQANSGMERRNGRRRRGVRILIGLAICAALIPVGLWYGRAYVERRVRAEIETTLSSLESIDAGGRRLTLQTDSLAFDLFDGWLKIDRLDLRWLSPRVTPGADNAPASPGETPQERARLHDEFTLIIDSLRVSGIAWWDAIFHGRAALESVALFNIRLNGFIHSDDPLAAIPTNSDALINSDARIRPPDAADSSIEFMLKPHPDSLDAQTAAAELLFGAVELLGIQRLTMDSISIAIDHVAAGDTARAAKLNYGRIAADDLAFYRRPGGRFLASAGSVRSHVVGAGYLQPGQDYMLSLESFAFDSDARSVKLAGFNYYLTIDAVEYLDKFTFREDAFSAVDASLVCSGMDVNRLLRGDGIDVDKMLIEHMQFEVLSDKRHPVNPEGAPPQMPHEAIRNLPFYVNIDSLQVRNARLVYAERQKDWSVPGQLFWERMRVDLTGLNNDSSGGKQSVVHLRAAGDFMSEGNMFLDLKLPMYAAGLDFTCEGGLDGMALNNLNQFVSIGELIRIDEGRNESARFSLTARNGLASGTVDARYRNLRITLLDKEHRQKGGLFSRFQGFLANAFVIRTDNQPEEDGSIEKGTINYRLKSDDTFLAFLWKSVRSGLGDLLGFG